MNTGFNRRQFLAASSAITIAGASGSLLPATEHFRAEQEEPWFKVSLAQWSLHRALKAGEIDNLDFPKITKEEFGIAGVEYVNQFFKDKAEDEKYLGQLKKRCEDAGGPDHDRRRRDQTEKGRQEPSQMGRRGKIPGMPLRRTAKSKFQVIPAQAGSSEPAKTPGSPPARG